MQRISNMLHDRRRDDFSDLDHQEYVERGSAEIMLIGGAALLLVGGFILSLM